MVETAVSVASTLFGNFLAWHPAPQAVYIMIAMSALSAIIISRIVGSSPFVSVPLGFVVLYGAAMILNFAAVAIPMVEMNVLQKAMVFSVLGHFIGGIFVLGVFRLAER